MSGDDNLDKVELQEAEVPALDPEEHQAQLDEVQRQNDAAFEAARQETEAALAASAVKQQEDAETAASEIQANNDAANAALQALRAGEPLLDEPI